MLLKGIEEEVLLGTRSGESVAVSARIASEFADYVTEPDGRNIEYSAGPRRDYHGLFEELSAKRLGLRRVLRDIGDYTVIPGGAIPLDPAEAFHIADADNPYYRFIRDAYGDRVVTASVQINIGIDDTEQLLRIYRVLRCEAAMYLALTAASPFYRGKVSGYHSTRWHIFPGTPVTVPLHEDHGTFVQWVEQRIETGEMFNRRHLWVAARPNGPASPYELDRLELRICDSISNTDLLQAVTALLEARVHFLLENPDYDPLAVRPETDVLHEIAANEDAVARSSLGSEIIEWRSGRPLSMRCWIANIVEEIHPAACRAGLDKLIDGLAPWLADGNVAQRWIRRIERGESVGRVVSSEVVAAEFRDGFVV